MNCRLPQVLIAASLVAAAAAEEPSFLLFANKAADRLSGSLQSLAGDQLVWNAPILKQPTPFWLKSVLEVRLPTTTPELNVSHEASLHLMNGDVVRGQLASVTDEVISLDTWYAGRLEFRRVMVKEVDVEDRASLIFTGPTGLDGWIQTAKTPTWSYEGGALRTSTSRGIGREVGLPDEVSLAFDLAWRGSLMMNLNLFADDITTDSPKRGYQLSCQGSYVSITRLGGNMMQGGGGVGVPEFKENEQVRIEVRASRVSGSVSLYVNGRHAGNWKDQDVKGKLGKAIQFVPQGGVESIRISKIRVSAWDGVVENAQDENAAMMGMGMGIRRFGLGNVNPEPKPEPKPKAPEEGRMKLRNGDSIGGEVVSIVDGIITVKTPFAEVKLPVARVRNIVLKPVSLEEPIRRNGDVRAWFADGSSMVFRLDATTKDTLTGSSQTFGSATFKTAAFNRIEFNIHDPEMNDLRAKDKF
jgi:hypothetical protein